MVNRLIRKAPGLMADMHSRVNYTRNDQRVYADQLEKELTAGILTASQKETTWTNLMQLSLEEKRHAANLIRTNGCMGIQTTLQEPLARP